MISLSSVRLTSLKIDDSKYCSYKMDELVTSVTEADGYEDKFTILKTGQDFKEFNVSMANILRSRSVCLKRLITGSGQKYNMLTSI